MRDDYEEHLGSLAFRYLLENEKIPLDAALDPALDPRRTWVGDFNVHLGIISGGQVHTHHVSSWKLLLFLDQQQKELLQLVCVRLDKLESRMDLQDRHKSPG